MYQIFIDGKEGTTGLQIFERLRVMDDIEILQIDSQKRKNEAEKREVVREADLVVLCLPDEMSKKVVQANSDTSVKVIDASTAFRTDPNWTYGLPELSISQAEEIRNAECVSNPGCYPTGFLMLVKPLIEQGILKKNSVLNISAISGYSGGGRKLIERYDGFNSEKVSARPYGLSMAHKHLPEMTKYSGLLSEPLFLPIVANFYQGMTVSVPLQRGMFIGKVSIKNVHEVLSNAYEPNKNITVFGLNDEEQLQDGFLNPHIIKGTDRQEIFIYGHDEQMVLISRLDNLGKGASGAAIQNLNLMLGFPEYRGLAI